MAGSRGSKAIFVLEVKVTLTVDKSAAVPGGSVTMKATVTVSGSPARGVSVLFYYLDSFSHLIGEATTDESGVATYTWTVPWDIGGALLPCTRGYLQAEAVIEGLRYRSNRVSFAVAYPTRLTVTTDKTKYLPGAPVHISILLEYNDRDTWRPLANQTVYVTAFGITYGLITDSEGKASMSCTAPWTPGMYWISGNYVGTAGIASAYAQATLAVARPALGIAGIAALAAALFYALLGR
jgi:hypothetical protein